MQLHDCSKLIEELIMVFLCYFTVTTRLHNLTWSGYKSECFGGLEITAMGIQIWDNISKHEFGVNFTTGFSLPPQSTRICAILGNHTAYSSNPRVAEFLLEFLTLEDGIYKLSRNVGKESLLYSA